MLRAAALSTAALLLAIPVAKLSPWRRLERRHHDLTERDCPRRYILSRRHGLSGRSERTEFVAGKCCHAVTALQGLELRVTA